MYHITYVGIIHMYMYNNDYQVHCTGVQVYCHVHTPVKMYICTGVLYKCPSTGVLAFVQVPWNIYYVCVYTPVCTLYLHTIGTLPQYTLHVHVHVHT